jgi:hypothetical protein
MSKSTHVLRAPVDKEGLAPTYCGRIVWQDTPSSEFMTESGGIVEMAAPDKSPTCRMCLHAVGGKRLHRVGRPRMRLACPA